MARSRNIKPGFFVNEDLAEQSFETRLLFIGLWTLADREGRLGDRPKRIHMSIFPGDPVNVDEMLEALHRVGLIQRYQVDGARYIQVTNFLRHQTPHYKERESVIPPPSMADRPTTPAPSSPHQPETHEPASPHQTAAPERSTAGDPGQARGMPGATLGETRASPSRAHLIPDSGFLIPDSGFLNPDIHTQRARDENEQAGIDPQQPSRTVPADWHPDPELEREARPPAGIDRGLELRNFRSHTFARPKDLAEWDGEWIKWLNRCRPPTESRPGDVARIRVSEDESRHPAVVAERLLKRSGPARTGDNVVAIREPQAGRRWE